VEPLVAAGFTAVVLDAPGHGEVPAPRTSILHFAAALRAAVDSFGPARCVVGHSLGGAAVAYALREGLVTDGVVLIGTPHAPGATFGHFLSRIGIDARQHQRITDEAERQFGFRFGDLVVSAPADRPPLPAIVIHDRDDREVGYDDALQIARDWASAKLVTTSGLGHHRILRDAAVTDHVVTFARIPSHFEAT
jgi:pimeloyl-ACP methyl ester carboxylesterase